MPYGKNVKLHAKTLKIVLAQSHDDDNGTPKPRYDVLENSAMGMLGTSDEQLGPS